MYLSPLARVVGSENENEICGKEEHVQQYLYRASQGPEISMGGYPDSFLQREDVLD